MTCDRERRHARSLDRARCDRMDNRAQVRPDADWLLSEYSRWPAHVIASRIGATEYQITRWIDLARQRHVYRQRFHRKNCSIAKHKEGSSNE